MATVRIHEGGSRLAQRLRKSVRGDVLFDDFSRGLAALAQDLGERMADTVILTMSEFGRAVAENGSRGTDHGHGNAMFLIGGGVKGGEVYGKWPGLREGDDPARRTEAGAIAEIRAYLRAGIDGFFTDDPAIGRAAVST